MQDLQAEFLQDFVEESREGLDVFDRELLVIERGESTGEGLNALFRTVHTLKGTSGCLGFSRIENLALSGEMLLRDMRDGKISATAEIVGVLLRYGAALRVTIDKLATDRVEPEDQHTELIRALQLDRFHEAIDAAPELIEPPPETVGEEVRRFVDGGCKLPRTLDR